MSNPTEPELLFGGAIRGQRLIAAAVFRCGVCNALVVDEPGEICEACTAPAEPPGRRTGSGSSSSSRPRRTTTAMARAKYRGRS